MKAITLYQPHATLVVIGAKRIETRPRPWAYLGRVVIHAARKSPREFMELCGREPFRSALLSAGYSPARTGWGLPAGQVIGTAEKGSCVPIPADPLAPDADETFTACLCGHIREAHEGRGHDGVCRVSTRWVPPMSKPGEYPPTNSFDGTLACCACPAYRPVLTDRERSFGDYTPGRFAYALRKPRPLDRPFPFAGHQGPFTVPDELIAAAQGGAAC